MFFTFICALKPLCHDNISVSVVISFSQFRFYLANSLSRVIIVLLIRS